MICARRITNDCGDTAAPARNHSSITVVESVEPPAWATTNR